ncbi:MAG TPA: hydrogenase nickel incorporation protein HypB [Blastocatellia bacterium]|nr:hydrogenase nickel incorporation protein HypB [Blastocatellia bacterium]
MHKIEIEENLLHLNEEIAERNRTEFQRRGLFAVNMMSAPGAGKTSVLERTVQSLRDVVKIAVIEGDLHTTYDSDRMSALGVPAYQITTGTVCHLDARMVHNALQGFELEGVELLFIENVGNLVCPAEFYLGEDLKVMVYSTVEGAEKPKKYPLMFHEVEAVLLNKIDLVPYSGVSVEELTGNVREVNPQAAVFPVSCRTGEGIDAWVRWLISRARNRRPGCLKRSEFAPAG